MTVFELQDSQPLPTGRRVRLADGREGVLIWEYEARGGQSAERAEAIGIRVSVLYHAEKRRRYVTSIFSLDASPGSLARLEQSILELANDDSKKCSVELPPGDEHSNDRADDLSPSEPIGPDGIFAQVAPG